MSDVLLSVEDVSKSFGNVQAIDHVSMEIRKGEVVGLIGENGAGKSTLLKALCGLLRPDTGRIVLRGEAVTESVARRRTRKHGVSGAVPIAKRDGREHPDWT